MSASIQQSHNSPTQNLWDIAVTRLSDKERAHLDVSSNVKLDELLSTVQSRVQECEQRQWTVKHIVLRDVFTKIARWIEKFIEVGDVTVQYDPGHAALPWAALRFLLKVFVQNINQYALVVEGAEKVAYIVTRHRIVERLYLAKEYEATTQLQDHITDLYVVALKFLVKAKKFYLKNTAMRALKNLTDFNSKLRGHLESIVEKDQETKRYTALVDAEYRETFGEELATLSLNEKNNHQHLKGVLDNIQMPIDRIERDVHDLRDDLSDAKRSQIIQWISPIPYKQHHNQVKKDLMDGTGEWFLNGNELLEWRGSSTSSIMWLRGIAGSGKSKLISLFIQQQLDEFRERKNPNPIYFYCARNPAEPERSKPDAVLRSLVRQLSVRNPREAILEPVRKIYKAREDDFFDAGQLSLEESTALIVELSRYRQLTTIIVDALDECEEKLRLELLDAFKYILQASSGLVKILVSSREVGDIAYRLEGCLNLEILASKNQADIARFVDRGVDDLVKDRQLLSGKVSDELRKEIKQVLCDKAGGMFRWVSLQLDFLRGLQWEPAVRSRLQELPTKLLELYNETYVQKLESRPKSEQILTKNALRMLLCLQIPLRTGDFMLALCSCEEANLSAEGLVDLCSSFVVLDTGLDIFRFAHLSVREFLETKSDYEPDKNHALVAELCLRYFPNDIVTQSAETWNNEQAGSEWDPQKDGSSSVVLVHKHPSKAPAACERMIFGMGCKSCGQGKDSIMWDCATIEGPTLYFCGDCVKKGRICKYEHHCPLTISLLYGGTEHSIPKEAFDENDHIYADAPISTLSTVPIFLDGFHQYSCFYWPFHLRESSGHRLSSPLQSISIDFMIGHQQTASASFVSWNNTMLRAIRAPDRTWGYDLFAHRAKAVCDGVSQPADCIFIATIWGFSNILELRVDINPNNVNNVSQREGSPALHLASGHGNLRAAQILLEKGAMLEDRNCHGYNALDIAVQNQRPEIVNLLLERGADARFKQGALYPLQQAVGLDHLVIIQLLLKYGADPEMGGMIDPSAMILAATKGNEDAMKLLVDYLAGTENSTKSLWKTVTRIQKVMRTEGEAGLLHSLSAWPSGTIANQLLGTVLWVAVMRKEEACARLLLSRRADPNTMIEKKSVFDVAARHLLKGDMRQLKFAETLLAHGARPDIRRYHRSSVENLIGWGVNHNIPDLVRLCADTGANFNKNSLYNPLYYPLYDAVEIRNVEMVRFVLERGADPKDVSARFFSGDIKPRDGDRYSLQGSEVIGDLLLEYGGTR